MDILKRLLAVFLALTALAVFFNLILTPVYHDGSPDYPVWEIINWFMAVAAVVALVVSFLRSQVIGNSEAGSGESVWARMVFYGAIALVMLFFWGWIWTLNPDSETGDAVTSHVVYFPIVDALFVLVSLDVARYLWNRG